MDCGSNYIKMCEKAEEIHSLRRYNLEVGDYAFEDNHIIIIGSDRYQYRGKGIWLPRQDQLQEMVKDGLAWLHVRFDEFVRSRKGEWLSGEIQDYDSFEQLWLAFVMREKFGKAWDGKEWNSGLHLD